MKVAFLVQLPPLPFLDASCARSTYFPGRRMVLPHSCSAHWWSWRQRARTMWPTSTASSPPSWRSCTRWRESTSSPPPRRPPQVSFRILGHCVPEMKVRVSWSCCCVPKMKVKVSWCCCVPKMKVRVSRCFRLLWYHPDNTAVCDAWPVNCYHSFCYVGSAVLKIQHVC